MFASGMSLNNCTLNGNYCDYKKNHLNINIVWKSQSENIQLCFHLLTCRERYFKKVHKLHVSTC